MSGTGRSSRQDSGRPKYGGPYPAGPLVVFHSQWLIGRTGEEILAREVFHRFKTYADYDSGKTMRGLLPQIHRAAAVYRRFVTASTQMVGPLDRLGLFAHRTSVLESEVVKPLVLFLLDPEEPAVPDAQLTKALRAVESWLVRRMLVRATTKSYNRTMADLISQVRKADRGRAGDIIEDATSCVARVASTRTGQTTMN